MQEFIDKVKKLWVAKGAKDELTEKLGEASKTVEGLKLDVMKMMEALEIEKQHVPECGTVYRQKEFSVQVPKTPGDKEALFNWIAVNKGKDVLDNMLSIHSQSLNSFYKSEFEIAKEEGNVDFSIPGIKAPEVYYKLGMKSK